jgi:hypothetical protein
MNEAKAKDSNSSLPKTNEAGDTCSACLLVKTFSLQKEKRAEALSMEVSAKIGHSIYIYTSLHYYI